MAKFRKKPVVIEAEQWNGQPIDGVKLVGCKYCWPRACLNAVHSEFGPRPHHGEIETLEGAMQVSPGDWVITGVNGERYPCKPEIFAKTYETANETMCCFIGCTAPAVFEIHNPPDPYDLTEACEAHVGALLGVRKGHPQPVWEWQIRPIEAPKDGD